MKKKSIRLLTVFLAVLFFVFGGLTGTWIEPVRAATALETAKADLAKAQKEYDEVQAEVDLGSIGFFTWNGCEYNKDYFDSITESAATDTTGTKITAYTNLGVSTDSTSLDNLEVAVDWIDECNSLREKEGRNDLLVKDELMFSATIHNNYVMNSGDFSHPKVFSCAENIAGGQTNPFTSWYDKEKELYDSGVRSSSVGHYINIISPQQKVTGFAVGQGGKYRRYYTQDFSNDTDSSSGKIYTTDEYRARIKEYRSYLDGLVSKAQSKLDSAQKVYDQALIDATKVTLSSTSVSLEKGNSKTISATVTGDTSQKVSWSSSNTGVATVSGGKITAVGKGTATITARTGNGKSATCKVTVMVPDATSVLLSKSSLSLTTGSSSTLTASVSPSNADQTVAWTSSNTSVATVFGGKVTGVKAGSATIIAKTSNGKTATCSVTVTTPVATGVTLSKTSVNLTVGSTTTLTATVTPSAAPQTVTWTTSNSKVATVSNGTIKGVKAGSATITAKTSNGKTAICTVTVTAASTTKAVYRLFNPSTSEHLYTTDANEYDILWKKHGWGKEGVGWYAPSSGTAVYRLYQPGLDNHLYTTDKNEINVLTTKYGWIPDNNGQPVFYSGGSVSIYRVYNKNLNGLHHLTTGLNEYNTLPKYGWKQEGTKLYASKIGNTLSRTDYYGK